MVRLAPVGSGSPLFAFKFGLNARESLGKIGHEEFPSESQDPDRYMVRGPFCKVA